jgi:hypothetical protein
MSEKPHKDDVIRELIAFFEDGMQLDPRGLGDWLAQGDWDSDDFIAAVQKLKRELSLREST